MNTNDTMAMRVPLQIVSGGQTGADRAALDWAIDHGVAHGGWCPKERKAEDGTIPGHYSLRETPNEELRERTEWNVRDSDGTAIFSLQPFLAGGSKQTAELAQKHGKPMVHLFRHAAGPPPEQVLIQFLSDHPVQVLNVAGPRASEEAGIAEFVREVLDKAFGGTRGG